LVLCLIVKVVTFVSHACVLGRNNPEHAGVTQLGGLQVEIVSDQVSQVKGLSNKSSLQRPIQPLFGQLAIAIGHPQPSH
jgi:hypothetical protein